MIPSITSRLSPSGPTVVNETTPLVGHEASVSRPHPDLSRRTRANASTSGEQRRTANLTPLSSSHVAIDSDLPAPPAIAATAAQRHYEQLVRDAHKEIGPDSTFTGKVSVKDGRLTSNDRVINALLNMADLNPNDFSQLLNPKTPVSLSFTLHPEAARLYPQLNQALTVNTVPLKPSESTPLLAKEEKIDTSLLAMHMLQLLQDGPRAAQALVQLEGAAAPIPIRQALAEMRTPLIRSEQAGDLAVRLEEKLFGDADRRVKMAACAMLQMDTLRKPDKVGVLLSMLFSATVGLGLKGLTAATGWLADKALNKFAASASVQKVVKDGIDILGKTVSPIVLETGDNLVVLDMMKNPRGGSTGTMSAWVERAKENWDDAFTAGQISAAASVPDTLIEKYPLSNPVANGSALAAANILDIYGAASGMAPEIKSFRSKKEAGAAKGLATGLLATDSTAEATQIKQAKELATLGVLFSPNQDHLRALPLIGAEGLLTAAAGTVLNPLATSMVHAVNQVTEATNIFAVNHYHKRFESHDLHSQLMEMALTNKPVKAADLKALSDGPLVRAGDVIAKSFNGTLAFLQSGAALTGLMDPPEKPLIERVDIHAMQNQATAQV